MTINIGATVNDFVSVRIGIGSASLTINQCVLYKNQEAVGFYYASADNSHRFAGAVFMQEAKRIVATLSEATGWTASEIEIISIAYR